jgi:hypothetical protein
MQPLPLAHAPGSDNVTAVPPPGRRPPWRLPRNRDLVKPASYAEPGVVIAVGTEVLSLTIDGHFPPQSKVYRRVPLRNLHFLRSEIIMEYFPSHMFQSSVPSQLLQSSVLGGHKIWATQPRTMHGCAAMVVRHCCAATLLVSLVSNLACLRVLRGEALTRAPVALTPAPTAPVPRGGGRLQSEKCALVSVLNCQFLEKLGASHACRGSCVQPVL